MVTFDMTGFFKPGHRVFKLQSCRLTIPCKILVSRTKLALCNKKRETYVYQKKIMLQREKTHKETFTFKKIKSSNFVNIDRIMDGKNHRIRQSFNLK